MPWTGQDWALALGGAAVLFTALLTGIGSFITSMVTLRRIGDVNRKVGAVDKKVDGMLVDRDAANVAAGTVIGRQAGDDASAQRAEGRRQEREIHREAAALAPHPSGVPVPVADDRTAVAAERGATANERIADAAEKKD